MNEPDNFLNRWSRRKIAAAEDNLAPDKLIAADEPAAGEGEAPASAAACLPEVQTPAPAEPEFDVSSLPPIDAIGADTDISVFFKPGVPSALRHAALRRAWTADPAIRDFKGLAENDWDFNDPDAIPGFGKLAPDFDVRKLVARVFGEEAPDEPLAAEPSATNEQPAPTSSQSDPTDTSARDERAAAETSEVESCDLKKDLLQREENIALHQDSSAYSNEQDKPRRHGGALPHVFP
jgi:hypothetical protein